MEGKDAPSVQGQLVGPSPDSSPTLEMPPPLEKSACPLLWQNTDGFNPPFSARGLSGSVM